MKKSAFVFALLFVSSLVLNANAAGGVKKQNVSTPESYEKAVDDGGYAEDNAPQGAVKRNPNNSDLPYPADEIDRNNPENYKSKNMPVDED